MRKPSVIGPDAEVSVSAATAAATKRQGGEKVSLDAARRFARTDVFISYSRRDSDFVHRLNDALKAREKVTWVDWEGILPSAEWLKEIYTAIEATATVVYVISPDSVASEVCTQEINHAVANNKRIVPIVYREVPPEKVPAVAAAHNWIFFRDGDDFNASLESLILAIDTDIAWAHTHARLLIRATEWEAAARDNSLLLQASDLHRAELRLSRNSDKRPVHTPIQIEYILASRRRASRRRSITIGIATVTLFSIILLSLLLWENGEKARVYLSRDFHAKAVWALADNDMLSAEVLLAKSLTLDDERDTRERYLEAHVRRGRLLRVSPAVKNQHFLAVSADAGYALVKTPSGPLSLWDLTGRKEPVALKGAAKGLPTSAVFGRKDGLLAIGYGSGAIELWEVQTASPVGQFTGHARDVTCLAFSRDGRTLASGGKDLSIRLWDVSAQKPVRILRGHTEQISSLAFSPDGRTLASGSWDKLVWLWDVSGGTLRRRLKGHEDGVLSVAFSPNGRYLASGSWDTNVWLWDAATGQALRFFAGSMNVYQAAGIVSIAFSPDMQWMATGSEYGIVRLWTVETARNRQTILAHHSSVVGLAFTPDRKEMITAGSEDTLRTWDMERVDRKPELFTLRGHTSVVSIVAFDARGRLFSGGEDETVREWDPVKGRPIRVLRGHKGGVWAVAFSPDKKTMATASPDATVRLWDTQTGKTRLVLHAGAPVRTALFHPRQPWVATGGDDRMVRLWDINTGRQISRWEEKSEILCADFSSDGKLVAVGSQDGNIYIGDVQSRKSVGRTLRGHVGAVWGVAFTPDGQSIVSCGADGTIRIWDFATRRQKQILRGHKGGIWDIALDRDGKTVVSAGQDGTVRLWSMETKEETTLRVHASAVWSVALSPDGTRLASAGQDRTVRVWNLPRLRALLASPPGELLEQSQRETGLRVIKDEVIPADASGAAEQPPDDQNP